MFSINLFRNEDEKVRFMMFEEGFGEVFECCVMMKCGVDSNLCLDFWIDKFEYFIYFVFRFGVILLLNKSDYFEIVVMRVILFLVVNKSICCFY